MPKIYNPKQYQSDKNQAQICGTSPYTTPYTIILGVAIVRQETSSAIQAKTYKTLLSFVWKH